MAIVKGIEVGGEVYDIEDTESRETLETQSEQIGNLDDLQTEEKTNLVSAINEAAQGGGGGGSAWENISEYWGKLTFTGELESLNSEVRNLFNMNAWARTDGKVVEIYAVFMIDTSKTILAIGALEGFPEKFKPKWTTASKGSILSYGSARENAITPQYLGLFDPSSGEPLLDGLFGVVNGEMSATGVGTSYGVLSGCYPLELS